MKQITISCHPLYVCVTSHFYFLHATSGSYKRSDRAPQLPKCIYWFWIFQAILIFFFLENIRCPLQLWFFEATIKHGDSEVAIIPLGLAL